MFFSMYTSYIILYVILSSTTFSGCVEVFILVCFDYILIIRLSDLYIVYIRDGAARAANDPYTVRQIDFE